jgi:acyl-coenzyme A thioesterase PaaI-like protein
MLDRLNGLALLRAICEGCVPSPAFARLLKLRLVDVSEGKVRFEATPSAKHYNYAAIVHGFTMARLDSALGSAVTASTSYRARRARAHWSF